MSRSSRRLPDEALFAAAMRDAKPLRKQAKITRRAADPLPMPAAQSLPPTPAPGPVPREIKPNPGIDRSTAEKLRKGKLPVDRRLDLHGMTEAAAHALLDRCVRDSWMQGDRVLLVITGKGRSGEGVLRRNLPRWLAIGDTAAKVLRVTRAQPRDGGDGAFYVLLRRRRAP